MIAKGTPHKNGALLARYLVTGKDRERAELWQLRGFALGGIVDAFRSVHVMAGGTRCRAPFFHVYVRNREGESLNREQWERTADRIERVLGLNDQPRAIAFHTAEDTGDCHMHIAWSRIDQHTLTAKPLPFFKERLKKASRELEELFDLPPVPNQRETPIRFAPTRAEEEQARRLGLDVHIPREFIRNCFEISDCGKSFEAALASQGLVLARGDSRDFLVVDREGGMHALGKRILGVSAAEIRRRLADLCRDHLPTLEQARKAIDARRTVPTKLDATVSREQKVPKKPARKQTKVRAAAPKKNSRAAGKEPARDDIRRLSKRSPAVAEARVRPLTQMDRLIIGPQVGNGCQPAPQRFHRYRCAEGASGTQLVTAFSATTVHPVATEPPAPSRALKGEDEAIDQTREVILEPSSKAANEPENLHMLIGPEEQISVPRSDDESAGPAVDTEPLLPPEPPLPAPKKTSFAAGLKVQFRALVKQLITRDPVLRPTSRKRRRDEMGGGFRVLALALLRRVARIPPLHFLDPAWEPFTWLRIWEWTDTAENEIAAGAFDRHDNHTSPHP